MKKKIVAGILLVVMMLCYGCGYSKQVKQIKSDASGLLDWYKVENGLSKSDDLSMLVTEQVNDEKTVLAINNIRAVGFAKAIGIDADYEKFYQKLAESFKNVYPTADSVKAEYSAYINYVSETLLLLGKDPTNFCDYNIVLLGTYQNDGFEYAGLYDGYGLMLRILEQKPQNGHNVDTILQKIIAEIDSKNGWGYSDWQTGEYTTDIDTTANVLYGLSAYYDYETKFELNDTQITVKEACDKAFELMLTYKNSDFTFKSAYSDASSSTTASVLSAASKMNINFLEDNRLSNKDTNILNALNSFKNNDGGYRAGKDESPSDSFSFMDTLKAFYTAIEVIQ